jgi:nucleotide-binding universal stress UspA family protein
MSTILIPLDGSIGAERVLEHLSWLAPSATTHIVLISVVSTPHYVYGAISFSSLDLHTTIWNDTQEYLEQVRARLQAEGYHVTVTICGGDPAVEILDMARSLEVDMVAMTTHGHTGFVRWALGSVAERVIQASTFPVFLVRASFDLASGPPARIMVPLDGSKFSERALPLATEIAHRLHSEVLLLNAFSGAEQNGSRLYVGTQAELYEMIDHWRTDMGNYLAERAEQLGKEDVVVQTRMVVADAAAAIHDFSEMDNVGLIVMSTCGRSGMERWVYGSVANRVLRAANCPILLLPPSPAAVKAAREKPAPHQLAPHTNMQ